MWTAWLLTQASSPAPPGSWDSFIATWGPAALPIFGLVAALGVIWKDRNAERTRADGLTERLLEQQEKLLPLAKDLVDALRRLERSS